MSEGKFTVVAYVFVGVVHRFAARDRNHAREIATRMLKEGLWVDAGGTETFFPVHQIVKVKIITEEKV